MWKFTENHLQVKLRFLPLHISFSCKLYWMNLGLQLFALIFLSVIDVAMQPLVYLFHPCSYVIITIKNNSWVMYSFLMDKTLVVQFFIDLK